MQAFSIFNPGAITIATGLDADTCLPRLAQAFRLPASSLIKQYNEILPAAMKKMEERNDDFAAWREAILETSRPLRQLREVVLRLGTWSGMTTSGVEQVHRAQEWLLDG